MQFKTIEGSAMMVIKKGFWRVNFKDRQNDIYFDPNSRTLYETDLRDRLFSDNADEIVINKNTYPFNLCDSANEQYVIWIRDKINDPEIGFIVKIIEEKFPEMDHLIYVNKPMYRSIKSILHYHCIIKPKSEPAYLKKLTIFHRHANRYPIIKSETFEPAVLLSQNPRSTSPSADKSASSKVEPAVLLSQNPLSTSPSADKSASSKVERVLSGNNFNESMEHDSDAKLLPIGHFKSLQFGKDIKQIYLLEDYIVADAIYLTSPKTRCKETMYNIINGLTINKDKIEIHECTKLIFNPTDYDLEAAKDNDIIDTLFDEYYGLVNKLESIIKLYGNYYISGNDTDKKGKLLSLVKIYEYHTAIQCYGDLGVNISDFVDDQLEIELNESTEKVCNILYHCCQLTFSDVFKDLIDYTNNFDCKLLMCSTHDSLILPLAKYLAYLNKNTLDLELPCYLSNVRIEEWSDGIIRIYYNNRYLGSMME